MSKKCLNLALMEERISKSAKTIPEAFQNLELWQINRRKFVQSMSVAALASQFSFFQSCDGKTQKDLQINDYLTPKESLIIATIQDVLFPDDGNGPSCAEIKAFDHLIWVISDERKNPDATQYIIDGIGWSDETAVEIYGRSFNELDQSEIEELVGEISEEKWGSSWLSIILTFIFEALALDPIYNINSDSTGWNWLGQFVGTPRPTIDITYDNFLKTVNAE